MSSPHLYLWQDSCCERGPPGISPFHLGLQKAPTTTRRGRQRLSWKSLFLIRLIWASALVAFTHGCTLITSVSGVFYKYYYLWKDLKSRFIRDTQRANRRKKVLSILNHWDNVNQNQRREP